MDTICYRRNPDNLTATVDVLEDYAKLNQHAIKEESLWCITRFDNYDKENDAQARKFLLKSLDTYLAKEVTDRSAKNDTFVDYLYHLIEEERPASMNTHLADIDLLKHVSPQDYPGVNVKSYCMFVREKIEKLENANHYDSSLNAIICRKLAQCVPNNHEYSRQIYDKLDAITAELDE